MLFPCILNIDVTVTLEQRIGTLCHGLEVKHILWAGHILHLNPISKEQLERRGKPQQLRQVQQKDPFN